MPDKAKQTYQTLEHGTTIDRIDGVVTIGRNGQTLVGYSLHNGDVSFQIGGKNLRFPTCSEAMDFWEGYKIVGEDLEAALERNPPRVKTA